MRRFRPELILVSAGFDAHRADPLAQMAVSEVGYRALATRLAEVAADVCDGRLALILEGGYDLDALARSVAECVRVLLGSTEPAAIDTTAIRSDVDRLLGVAAATHRLGE